jgi:hypothetical protein
MSLAFEVLQRQQLACSFIAFVKYSGCCSRNVLAPMSLEAQEEAKAYARGAMQQALKFNS